MKNIINRTAGLIVGLCALSLVTQAKTDRQPALLNNPTRPYLILRAPLEHPGTIALLNSFNDATIYSTSMNEILNGSGTDVHVGEKRTAESLLSQTMRVASLFDLYFSYEIRNSPRQQPAGEMAISLVPMSPGSAEQVDAYKFQMLPLMLDNWWKFITPVTGQFIKAEPTNPQDYAQYAGIVQTGMERELQERWPMMKKPRTFAPDWYLRAFQPLYTSSWLKLDGQDSFFKSTLLLSPIGMLDLEHQEIHAIDLPMEKPMDTGTAVIDRITYGNPNVQDKNVIRIQYGKDFKKDDKILMNVTFGRLAPVGGTDIARLVEDGDSTSEHWYNFAGREKEKTNVRHEDGLIAHGHLSHKDKNGNEDTFGLMGKNFDIEISIHRLALELKRPTNTWAKKSGSPAELIQDAPPFSVKDIHTNPDETMITFKISTNLYKHEGVPKDWKNRFGNATAEVGAQTLFCGLQNEFHAKQLLSGDCSLTFSSYRKFSLFFYKFYGDILARYVAKQVAGSSDAGIQSAVEDEERKMDKAMSDMVAKVMQVYKLGQNSFAILGSKVCASGTCSASSTEK